MYTAGATPRQVLKGKLHSVGAKPESKFIYDAIASASIVQNGAGVETSRSRVVTLSAFTSFLKVQQGERKPEAEIKALVEVIMLIPIESRVRSSVASLTCFFYET